MARRIEIFHAPPGRHPPTGVAAQASYRAREVPTCGPKGRAAAAASAAKPSRADARRITPEACLRHDAFEGHEGETFVRLVSELFCQDVL